MNDWMAGLQNIVEQSWRHCLLILILASPECIFANDTIAQEVKDRTIAATVVIRTDSAGELTHKQRLKLADGLVALFRRKEAEDAARKAAEEAQQP